MSLNFFASASTSGAIPWTPDRSKIFAGQLAAKERFSGEAGGIRLATREGQSFATPLDIEI